VGLGGRGHTCPCPGVAGAKVLVGSAPAVVAAVDGGPVMPSLNPDTFRRPAAGSDLISASQAAYLKAKGIEEGISTGLDEHWIENWLYDEHHIVVGDVEDLTRAEFRWVLEEMGWDS
jgi:hypothetical protein